MKKRLFSIVLSAMLASVLMIGQVATVAAAAEEKASGVVLSTTIGPVDAGIIDELINTYTDQNPNKTVRYIARGTGAAITLAESGDIDMVIVHAKSLEEKFVADGFGTEIGRAHV